MILTICSIWENLSKNEQFLQNMATKKQYFDCTKTLQEKEISIIVGIVLNHKAGGDETEKFHAIKVNPENRQQNISDPFEIESYTKFTFPGRKKTFSL
jgi:alpha-amylase